MLAQLPAPLSVRRARRSVRTAASRGFISERAAASRDFISERAAPRCGFISERAVARYGQGRANKRPTKMQRRRGMELLFCRKRDNLFADTPLSGTGPGKTSARQITGVSVRRAVFKRRRRVLRNGPRQSSPPKKPPTGTRKRGGRRLNLPAGKAAGADYLFEN